MFGENKTNGNLYRFDGVVVDCENFNVRKAGKIIPLTPRAFDVLVFLMKNNGRVVEKQEIFENIWKENFVSDNALTKVIKEIRRAIEDDAAEPRCIETVPKRGYRFIAKTENGTESDLSERNTITEPQDNQTKSSKHRVLLLSVAGGFGAVLLVLGVIVFSEWRSEIIAKTTPIDSIAVLPFEHETQDPELKVVSDSIAEHINNSLSQQTNLRVLPLKTISFDKAQAEDPRTIGRSLRVRAVLTGKVMRRDNGFFVQIELIDVERKAQIWGQQFEGTGDLKDEISRAAVDRVNQYEKLGTK